MPKPWLQVVAEINASTPFDLARLPKAQQDALAAMRAAYTAAEHVLDPRRLAFVDWMVLSGTITDEDPSCNVGCIVGEDCISRSELEQVSNRADRIAAQFADQPALAFRILAFLMLLTESTSSNE